MDAYHRIDPDKELAAVVGGSWPVRAGSRLVGHFERAWESSRLRPRVIDARNIVASASREQRAQLIAITAAVGAAAHLLLATVAARRVEPLTLLLPGVVLIVAVIVIAITRRGPRLPGQLR